MPKLVTVPGYKDSVEFPDSMSNEDIEKVLSKSVPKPMAFRGVDQPEPLLARKRAAGEKSLKEGRAAILDVMPAIGAQVAIGATGVGAPAELAALGVRYGPMMGRLIGTAGRLLAAGAGGEVGGLAAEGIKKATGDEKQAKDVRELFARAHEAGTQQMKFQVAGETIGGMLQSVAPTIEKAMSGTARVMRRSFGGRQLEIARREATIVANAAVVEEVNRMADQVVSEMGPSIRAEQLSVRAERAAARTDAVWQAKTDELYQVPKTILKGKTIDVTDTAQKLLALEKTVPRAKGTMKSFTEPDPEWVELLKRAEKASQPTTKEVPATTSEILDASGKPIVTREATTTVEPAVDLLENAPALVDARGTVARRWFKLKDQKDVPREYVDGLKKIRDDLDAKIENKLEQVGGPHAAATLKVAKNFYGAKNEILDQIAFKTLKKDPSKLVDLISPNDPASWAHIELAVKTATDAEKNPKLREQMGEVLPAVRRKFFEQLITDKQGKAAIFDLEPALDKYGSTVTRMMRDSKDVALLGRLKELSHMRNQIKDVPKVEGTPHLDWLIHGAVAASLTGSLGYGHHPAAAGLALGATLGVPMMIVKIADNPTAFKVFKASIRAMERNDPGYIAEIVRSVKIAAKSSYAQYKALSGATQMLMPSHQQEAPDAAPPPQK